MADINMRGLNNFARKLNKYKNINKNLDKIAQKVAERGKVIAQSNYIDTHPEITISKPDKNCRKIVAQGKGICFEEFGTGLVGKGTYEGNLPTQTIEFESPKGQPQTTHGWEYYYPNSATKVNGGWYANKVFHRGQKAKAQMFNTSKQLKSEVNTLVIKAIREMNK